MPVPAALLLRKIEQAGKATADAGSPAPSRFLFSFAGQDSQPDRETMQEHWYEPDDDAAEPPSQLEFREMLLKPAKYLAKVGDDSPPMPLSPVTLILDAYADGHAEGYATAMRDAGAAKPTPLGLTTKAAKIGAACALKCDDPGLSGRAIGKQIGMNHVTLSRSPEFRAACGLADARMKHSEEIDA
ncbi:MAG: hypothetical protein M3552_03535 [Planctomycetota bacterium]|nr:hypothetical protein [Planctomycetaceae bacterium]MDQ3329714.1 hypothetical protein [Planctomycetota bacterium]